MVVFHIMCMAKGSSGKKVKITNSEDKEIEVDAEIADDFFSRMRGLMGRKSLGNTEGMLFVFEKSEIHSFWMFNTKIPLDAIFCDEYGKVVDIITMGPCKSPIGLNCPNYRPKTPAKYVLEVNAGFASKRKISINSSFLIIAQI